MHCATEILELLRASPGPLTAEEAAGLLRVSVGQVDGGIRQLSEWGLRISRSSAGAYSLDSVPDSPVGPAVLPRLCTRRMGVAFRFVPIVDSTNQVAAALATRGAPEGTVVVAEAQTRGRGRLSRTWHSPYGVNLHVSIVLRPPVEVARAPAVAIAAAMAVSRAIEARHPGLPLGVKWPNDLLLAGRKAGGLLCELSTAADGNVCLILGLGLNVNARRDQFPPDLRESVASLREFVGVDVPRHELLADILNEWDLAYDSWLTDGLHLVKHDLDRLSVLVGREVRIEAAGAEISGVTVGVSPRGALVVRLADGSTREVTSGEAHVVSWQSLEDSGGAADQAVF